MCLLHNQCSGFHQTKCKMLWFPITLVFFVETLVWGRTVVYQRWIFRFKCKLCFWREGMCFSITISYFLRTWFFIGRVLFRTPHYKNHPYHVFRHQLCSDCASGSPTRRQNDDKVGEHKGSHDWRLPCTGKKTTQTQLSKTINSTNSFVSKTIHSN